MSNTDLSGFAFTHIGMCSQMHMCDHTDTHRDKESAGKEEAIYVQIRR